MGDRRRVAGPGVGKLAVRLLASLLACVVAGCGGDGTRGAAPADRPIVLGYASELQTLNPLVSTDQNANELIYTLLFTPLITYDADFEPRPWLARSWELTDEGVTFELRDDVTWDDGRPVTAEDVKFTFDLAKNPAVASPLAPAYLSRVESAEVLGPATIRFAFTEPHAEPLEDFYWPPVPRHLLADVAPEDMTLDAFGREPVGSGPYRLRSWSVGEGLEFEARETFPAELGGPGATARISYRILPDATSRMAQLRRGDLDFDGPISPPDAERLEGADGVEVVSFPWRQFTYVGWNTRRTPFAEPAARRALAMGIDRPELLRAILRGRGQVASSVIPPWHPFDPGLEPLPYAPDSAAALLEGLGWTDADGDGVRERDGEPLSFELLASNSNPVLGDLAEVIQAQLAAIGVRVEPRLLEWQTVLGRHRGRDFDAVLTNWVLDNFRVDPRPLFHSSQVAIERSANRSSYASPVADSLMDAGAAALDDGSAARIWRRFSEIVQRDQPLTILFWNDELVAIRSDIEGAEFDARGELVSLPRWRRSPEP